MEDLKNKILDETLRAIDYHSSCEVISNDITKNKSFTLKIKGVYNSLRLFILSLVQNIKYKKLDSGNESKKSKVIIAIDETCDPDAETLKIPIEEINKELCDGEIQRVERDHIDLIDIRPKVKLQEETHGVER